MNSISRRQSHTLLMFCLKSTYLLYENLLFLKWYIFIFSSSIKSKSFSPYTGLVKINSCKNFEVFSAVNKNVEFWVLTRYNLERQHQHFRQREILSPSSGLIKTRQCHVPNTAISLSLHCSDKAPWNSANFTL